MNGWATGGTPRRPDSTAGLTHDVSLSPRVQQRMQAIDVSTAGLSGTSSGRTAAG
ncbi:MAG TPA: hypothetical protein VGN30_03160 [Steroidobacteraceae bacterium]